MIAFLSPDAFVRRRAIEQLTRTELADPAVVYALRRLLASDRDVAVRALAAGALGSARAPDPIAWLVDALADISPVVRDSAIRALARHSASAAYAPLCTLARTDHTWWVRRAAIYALGVIGARVDVIAPVRAALSDPFWRVRHAAVQVLALHGTRTPERRPEILADVEGGTADYLRALWGPALVDDAPRDRIPSRLPPALLDRDPAVVTARLAEMDAPPALAIVELLCDPHVPLRTLAAARLIEANDADAFAAALHWLDEPRIPHVAATVTTMLDSLGNPARDLATRVLSSPSRPGASRWAIGWVVATRTLDLAELAWSRAVATSERALAMPIAPMPALVEALDSTDVELALAAADELSLRPAHVRREVLGTIAPHAHGAVRMRLAAASNAAVASDAATASNAAVASDSLASAKSNPRLDVHIAVALDDADPLARATALSVLGGQVSAETRRIALADPDPAVREAVVKHATLDELVALLAVERDPWIRRSASRAALRLYRASNASLPNQDIEDLVARSNHDTIEDLVVRSSADPDEDLVVRSSADPDEWIRTLAIPMLDPARADHLARIVALAADPSMMVQSAIVEKLATISDEQLRAMMPSGAIHAWIAAGDLAAMTAGEVAATTGELAAMTADDLAAMTADDVAAMTADDVAATADDLAAMTADDVAAMTADDLAAMTADDVAAMTADKVAATADDLAALTAGGVTATTGRIDAMPAGRIEIGNAPAAMVVDNVDSTPAIDVRAFGSVRTSPLVISGAFDLQPGSLRAAADGGVTTYFWEPPYSGMTRFLRGKRERVRSQVVTGTYHADERSIVKDVDRALRRLRRDVIDVYLLFWTRSDARVDEQAFEVMSALKRAGKVRAVGFSTHDRELASRAIDRSAWDIVMTRHSAAHPGIENGFLAHAKAKGVGVLTFTALCYGRMLKGVGAPSAQECYRYSLAQDGVTATISAPRRHRELVENLEVLRAPTMSGAEIERVRAHGAGVRVESQKFNALIRQPTRDAAAAAMAMLEGALAPGEGDRDEACMTPEALQRSLGSRGRGRASLPSAMLRRGRL